VGPLLSAMSGAARSGVATRGIGPALYVLWAAVAVGTAIALAGPTPESMTRVLVLGFLLVQLAFRSTLAKALPGLRPRTRFVVLGVALAAVVEGFHMISMPVFLSLRIGPGTSLAQGLTRYALDLLFTVPAYLVIFRVIWHFADRYRYSLWEYVVVMGLAQAVGDGGLFLFWNSPGMLVFLPYPMTNYHAINVLPFLAVRDRLRREGSGNARKYLAVPAVVGTYLVCGAVIKVLGRLSGLGPG
jgi:hypothetical protein